jgi:hypothetical protein
VLKAATGSDLPGNGLAARGMAAWLHSARQRRAWIATVVFLVLAAAIGTLTA